MDYTAEDKTCKGVFRKIFGGGKKHDDLGMRLYVSRRYFCGGNGRRGVDFVVLVQSVRRKDIGEKEVPDCARKKSQKSLPC